MAEPFDSMVSGIADTEQAILDDLRADLQTQGSQIANVSPFSAFFTLIGKLIAAPLLYLRGLVIDTVLPGLFLKTATGALLEIVADGYDVEKLLASKAKGSLTFTRSGSTGDLTIPAGTVVESPEIDGVVYRMITDTDTDILDGNTTALVAATAELAGAAHNLGDGYYTILPTAVPGVTAVANEAGWLTTAGTDDETDDPLRDRCRLKMAGLGQGTHGYYKSVIAAFTGAASGDIFIGAYGTRGFGSRDYFYLTGSGNPAQAGLDALNTHIAADGNHLDGDDVEVFALPGLNINLTATVRVAVNATAAERTTIQTGIEDMIRAAFRESSAFPAVPRVRPSEVYPYAVLTREILAAHPLVLAVDWTPAVINPAVELPILQTLTVTVV